MRVNTHLWEAFAKRMQFGEKNPLPHFEIDGEQPIEYCVKKAIDYIAQVA